MSNYLRRKLLRSTLALLLVGLFSLLSILGLVKVPHAAGELDPIEKAMSQMSIGERIGQLFLVAFWGNGVDPDSQFAELIREYHIGGVVLFPDDGNTSSTADMPRQIASVTQEMQNLALGQNDLFVPLFLVLQYDGNRLGDGLADLPSAMALGATWQPEDAFVVGEIAGYESRSLGINMIFGPSLDVLNIPHPGLKGDLATSSFGGDPFWVSRFGQAYIAGIHKGADGRVVTVSQHFPGLGAADRRPDDEIPTVPKSLSELRSIELAPFMAATTSSGQLSLTDGLMSTHIRYRGFQGNIRQLTRPISVDPQNLQTLLAEPEFAKWRDDGGILITDALGVPSIRRYYDPQLESFPYKRIAQDAFLAGNDILFLFQYGLTDNNWDEQFENIVGTIGFFEEKYATDSDFRDRVDESVLRILRLKHRMYGAFDRDAVAGGLDQDMTPPHSVDIEMSRIAKEAVTLIYPSAEDLPDRMPSPPSIDDDILIFTDSHEIRACETCPPDPAIAVDALENAMVRLYGPGGSAQIDPGRIRSLTFAQLKGGLLSPPSSQAGSAADVNTLISQADWIIFAMLDVNTDESPASDTVKTFLKLRSDNLRDKKMIVIAYGAPYYLDTTEISKLTAYYGVYSKTDAFIEASIRALFQEFNPTGVLPVSVEGINYDLINQTAPDSSQTIQLLFGDAENAEPGDTVSILVGSSLRLKTNGVLDRNGHIVPDGTPVRFRLTYPAQTLELPRREVFTEGGVAETLITLEHVGQLEVTASSDPATRSTTLIVTIHDDSLIATTDLAPNGGITATASSVTEALALDSGLDRPLDDISLNTSSSTWSKSTPRVTPVDLLLTLLGMLVLNVAGDLLRLRGGRTRSYRLHLILMAMLFGLSGYAIYALGIFGTWKLWYIYRQWGAIFLGTVSSIVPLVSVLVMRGIHVTRRTS